MVDALRFLFGSGWTVLWHLVLWLLGAVFVAGPTGMLVGDALKSPTPTPTLGTFVYLMLIAMYFALACVGSGLIAALQLPAPAWQRAAVAVAWPVIAMAVLLAASWWMGERPGRAAGVAYATITVLLIVGNLVVLYLPDAAAAEAAPGNAAPARQPAR